MKHAIQKYPMKHVAPNPYAPFIHYGVYSAVLIVGVFVTYVLLFAQQAAATALGNVTVNGHSFEGATHAQVVAALQNQEASMTINVTVNGTALEVPLKETGFTINTEATATEVLSHSEAALPVIGAFMSNVEVAPIFDIDEATFASFANKVSSMAGEGPKNATLALAPSGESYTVQPGEEGIGVPAEAIRTSLQSALTSADPQPLSFDGQMIPPAISTEEAEAALAQVNELLQKKIAIVTPRETVEANVREKAMWLNVLTIPSEDPQLKVHFSEVPVIQWVQKTVDAADRDPINVINHVDDQGNFLEIGRPGKPGIDVTNSDELQETVVAAAKEGKDVEAVIKYNEIPAGTESRVKPAGPERFAYRPRGNEKWVDINLTYSTLTAYQGTTPVYGPILINHGGVGHETVTGTYHVYLKYDKQDMGCTPDWPYCERDVPSVAYWHQSYALHAAPWVKEFGIGTDESSHGCINIPVPDALWLHGFTEIGTTVVSHYEPEG